MIGLIMSPGAAVESAKGAANDAEHRQATHLQHAIAYAKEIVTSVKW